MTDPARLRSVEQERDEATRLLRYALHLRMFGERAPGGSETWAEFDRRCEAFLRGLPPRPTPHLDSVKRRLDQALADRDAVSLIADELRAELTAVQHELGFSRQAEADLRAQLGQELTRRARLHEALTTALYDRQHLQAVHDQAIVRFADETERLRELLDQGRVYEAVETQPGTANGTWQHACCPAAGGQS